MSMALLAQRTFAALREPQLRALEVKDGISRPMNPEAVQASQSGSKELKSLLILRCRTIVGLTLPQRIETSRLNLQSKLLSGRATITSILACH
jgi:hypothetical protein